MALYRGNDEWINLRRKRATITQVAKHAGVSVGTVSNYLNGTAGVSHDRGSADTAGN